MQEPHIVISLFTHRRHWILAIILVISHDLLKFGGAQLGIRPLLASVALFKHVVQILVHQLGVLLIELLVFLTLYVPDGHLLVLVAKDILFRLLIVQLGCLLFSRAFETLISRLVCFFEVALQVVCQTDPHVDFALLVVASQEVKLLRILSHPKELDS